MTLDEFIERLKVYKGRFELDGYYIRHILINEEKTLCPIEYVYARSSHISKEKLSGEYTWAAINLRLNARNRSKIVIAADACPTSPMHPETRRLRNQMLEALGLQEYQASKQ